MWALGLDSVTSSVLHVILVSDVVIWVPFMCDSGAQQAAGTNLSLLVRYPMYYSSLRIETSILCVLLLFSVESQKNNSSSSKTHVFYLLSCDHTDTVHMHAPGLSPAAMSFSGDA